MPPFEPKDADFAARVAASFAAQNFMSLIGAQLGLVEPGAVEIILPTHAEISQQDGYVHGGVVGAIADSAAGYAAMSLMPAEAGVLTVEYKINFMAPGVGESLVAKGRVVRPGRQLSICTADVVARADGAEHMVATAQFTMMQMTGRRGNGA